MHQEHPYTIHVVLATIPLNQHNEYLHSIEEEFYNTYKKNNNEFYKEPQNENLYRPIKYYMFGNYDVAFVSLIDTFKFAQKLFIPDNIEGDFFNPNSFQVITGICLEYSGRENNSGIDEFFKEILLQHSLAKSNIFLSIINLKINNGVLIGNGDRLFKYLLPSIKNILESFNTKENNLVDYIILQSFSWYEISILCFMEDLNFVSEILKQLRGLTIVDLTIDNHLSIYTNSLYALANDFQKDETENVLAEKDLYAVSKAVHIASDSQTYLGINYSVVLEDLDDSLVNQLQNTGINAEIEWQVKPGHFGNLLQILEQLDVGINPSSTNKQKPDAYLLTGKSDYLMPTDPTSLVHSIKLARELYNGDNNIFRHVRKMKASVLLPAASKMPVEIEHKPSFQNIIKKLGIRNDKINAINVELKELKISRQLRNKIRKIFYNYNNGIQDHVLLPYFLDFYGFTVSLQREISTAIKHKNKPVGEQEDPLADDGKPSKLTYYTSISEMERTLRKFIRVFEEGHKIRSLNSYQFEDINDFDLDFNTSIQQLLSIYSSLILEISNLFYQDYLYSPVVQLNWNDTVANVVSVNYNIYHLLYPEFVFSTITKEILNQYKAIQRSVDMTSEASAIISHFDETKKLFDKAISENNFLEDYQKADLIDFNYLIIDSIRFVFTFNYDISLFRFWFWTFNFQNSSLYSSRGYLDEEHFKAELFRFTFLALLFGYEDTITEESCPLPEMQSFWSRYYYKTKVSIQSLFRKPQEEPALFSELKKIVMLILRYPLHKQTESVGIDLSGKWLNAFEIPVSADIPYFDDRWSKTMEGISDPELTRVGLDLMKRNACIQYFNYKYAESLSKGNCIYYEEALFENQHMFISALMYTYLKIIAETSNHQVNILRRDWDTGLPLEIFIRNEEGQHLYNVDPMGGVFFSTPDKLKQYFRMRNALLKSLWHFSQIQKRKYIAHIISKK